MQIMTSTSASASTAGLRRLDRWIILAGLIAVVIAAWVYLLTIGRGLSSDIGSGSTGGSGSMSGTMGSMSSMSDVHSWSLGESGLMLSMWMVMMVAMMLPSAVPMTLIYAAVARKAARDARPVAPTFVFVAGYIAVWCVFSVMATAAEYGLDRLALLSPAMVISSPRIGGILLIAAGVYELTPVKNACLAHCRAPAHFISRHWRHGSLGAAYTGMRLGVYCLGCCWVLMALLFAGGVMSLLWIAGLAAFVLAEKTVPLAALGQRLAAAALVLVGVATLSGVLHLS